jgi:hypothetical protein
MFGPVQQASNKEIQMLPEADRVGAIRAFWSTVPLYTTRGTAVVPTTHGEVPQGSLPGSVFTLSQAPPAGSGTFYVSGVQQTLGIDYSLDGTSITMLSAIIAATANLYFTWPVMVDIQAASSDIIQYEDESYRILQIYHDPGCGYYKALGTRLASA